MYFDKVFVESRKASPFGAESIMFLRSSLDQYLASFTAKFCTDSLSFKISSNLN
jgi:hypothetical protein